MSENKKQDNQVEETTKQTSNKVLDNLKEKATEVKNKITSEETKEKLKGAVDTAKETLTKENLSKAVDTVKDNLTKENLNKAVDTVKENLTKENLEKTVSNVKESFNEENREETIKKIKTKLTTKKVIAIIAIVLVLLFVFKACSGSKITVTNKEAPYGAEFNISFEKLIKEYNKNVDKNELCLDTLQYYNMSVSEDSLKGSEVDENIIGYQVKYNSSIMWVSNVNIYVNKNSGNVTNIVIETDAKNDKIDEAFNYVVPALWMAPVYDDSVEDVIENRLNVDYNQYKYEDGIFTTKSVSNLNTEISFWAMTDDYYEENFK